MDAKLVCQTVGVALRRKKIGGRKDDNVDADVAR
jgi:hypothetical protein